MFIEGAIPHKFLEAAARVYHSGTGAHAIFIGRVRPDKKEENEVDHIEFTAQQELASLTADEIIHEAKQEFSILEAEIWHSLGNVPVGKACFLVVVSGKHRKESFAALEYIVDEVKTRCAIFGREVFNDGTKAWKKNKT